MSDLEDDDLDFIEKVIEENREGLERLAREEDAAEKRGESFSGKLKRLVRWVKRKRKKDEAASFSRIEE